MRNLIFRVWDMEDETLLATTDGRIFYNHNNQRFGVTNYMMNPKRYFVTVSALSDDTRDIYGLDVVAVFSKDYKSFSEASRNNANIRLVLCDEHGFVKVDGKYLHVTELHFDYNYEDQGFAMYTPAYRELFAKELAGYGILKA